MTNHRKRQGAPSSGAPMMSLPAPPGVRPDAAKLIGKAVAAALIETLPDALAMANWRVNPPRMCALCILRYENWAGEHQGEIDAAIAAAAAALEAAGKGRDGPPAHDWRPFLPEDQLAGMPQVDRAVTTVRGIEVCRADVREALTT